MEVQYTWDPAKAEANLAKHGISFATASQVFADPHVIASENYHLAGETEQRYSAIGMVNGVTVIVVIFVDRSEADQEIIRIISARKATPYEENLYSAQG